MRILTNNLYGVPSGVSGDLFNADVFQDYDAVIVNPDDIESLYTDTFSNKNNLFQNKDMNLLEPEIGFAILSNSKDRREQVNGLLKHGGIVVCFMQPMRQYSYNEQLDGEENWNWITNYDWLLKPTEIRNELGKIKYGTGTKIDYIDTNHPFSEYLMTKPSWSAYVGIDACKNWKVLASAYGTHAVSLSKRVGLGYIVLLPSEYYSENGELLECCIKKLQKSEEVTTQPSWAKSVLVPGQEQLISKITGVNDQIDALEKERETLIKENEKLERWKCLLYAKGKHELEPVVREALTLIGFDVKSQPDKDSDGLIIHEDKFALLEVVGSKDSIRLRKFGELKKNIGNFIATKEKMVKGILVGNPFCEEPVNNRPPKDSQKKLFANELIESAEQQNVVVLLTIDLYGVVTMDLTNQLSEVEKQNIKDCIINGRGLVRISY